MSFQVKLMYNASEKNRVTKTTTDVYTLSGTLKAATSLLDPTILIASDTALTGVNYMYISEFGRYYFITDIVSVRTGLWEVHAHVDVLSSYATSIKQNTAVIRRQENQYNLYLDDGIFRSYQNPNIIVKEFPSGFNTFNYVLAIAGG